MPNTVGTPICPGSSVVASGNVADITFGEKTYNWNATAACGHPFGNVLYVGLQAYESFAFNYPMHGGVAGKTYHFAVEFTHDFSQFIYTANGFPVAEECELYFEIWRASDGVVVANFAASSTDWRTTGLAGPGGPFVKAGVASDSFTFHWAIAAGVEEYVFLRGFAMEKAAVAHLKVTVTST